MKFVLVTGRSPRPESFCALCCEPIGEGYLRAHHASLLLQLRVLPRPLHARLLSTQGTSKGIKAI